MSLAEDSQRNQVFELFIKGEPLTTKEIHELTGFPIDNIYQYINQFQNEGKIEAINKKGRFNIYQIITKEEKSNLDDIRFLLDFFQKFKNTLLEDNKIVDFMSKNKDRFEEIVKKY